MSIFLPASVREKRVNKLFDYGKSRHCVMAFPPLFAAHAAYAERVKAAMLYCCDLSPPRGERVRYAVRREAAHERSRSTAPVGLRRMRELRNCHFRGNLCPTRGESLACKRISTKWRTSAAREVPQAAHYIGAAKRCPAATVGVLASLHEGGAPQGRWE